MLDGLRVVRHVHFEVDLFGVELWPAVSRGKEGISFRTTRAVVVEGLQSGEQYDC